MALSAIRLLHHLMETAMAAEKDESPLKEFLIKIQDTVDKARRFWKTKRAIDRGEPLYDWSSSQLAEADYYGPWKFNAIETVLTGGLAAAVTSVIAFLNSSSANSSEVTTGPEFLLNLSPEVAAMVERTNAWTQPFLAPLLTTSVAFLVAWGSLKRRDSTSETRARARRAYLYSDGAFGFFSQLVIATGIGILAGTRSVGGEPADKRAFGDLAGLLADQGAGNIDLGQLVTVAMVAGAVLVQTYVSFSKIPKFLFTINSYSTRRRHFWQRSRPDDPPWAKIGFCQFSVGSLFSVAIYWILSLIALCLAIAFVWFKGLFH